MPPQSDNVPAPHLWKAALAYGVLTTILGVAIFAWPDAGILTAAILFGAYLIVSGVVQVISAFSLPVASTAGRVMMFISGAASLILAVLCFRSIADSVLLLAIWIAVGMIFRGVAEIVAAVGDAGLPGRGWLVVSGVLSLLAGFVLLSYPFSSLQVLALVTATWLVILGIAETLAAVRAGRTVKALTPHPVGSAA